MPLFDLIVVVDWSANSTPKLGPDSIWIGTLGDNGHSPAPVNLPTRAAATTHLTDLLRRHHGQRVLIGFDFSFGYPHGFAAAVGLGGDPPWRATWDHLAAQLTDDHRNRNNRWAVAADLNRRLGEHRFWGAPTSRSGEHLPTTRPAGDGPRALRATERLLRSAAGRAPFTAWQLYGAGAVGSQILTGIPALHRLRHTPDLADRIRVWPFETGFTDDPTADRHGAIVIAEVWPSTVALDPATHPIKDAQQVVALARHLHALDIADGLAARFAPTIPPDVAEAALAEEGWVLH